MKRRPCDHPESDVTESRLRNDGLRHRWRYCSLCTAKFETIELTREAFDKLKAASDLIAQMRTSAQAILEAAT